MLNIKKALELSKKNMNLDKLHKLKKEIGREPNVINSLMLKDIEEGIMNSISNNDIRSNNKENYVFIYFPMHRLSKYFNDKIIKYFDNININFLVKLIIKTVLCELLALIIKDNQKEYSHITNGEYLMFNDLNISLSKEKIVLMMNFKLSEEIYDHYNNMIESLINETQDSSVKTKKSNILDLKFDNEE